MAGLHVNHKVSKPPQMLDLLPETGLYVHDTNFKADHLFTDAPVYTYPQSPLPPSLGQALLPLFRQWSRHLRLDYVLLSAYECAEQVCSPRFKVPEIC